MLNYSSSHHKLLASPSHEDPTNKKTIEFWPKNQIATHKKYIYYETTI
jgi:hypothetical protein